MKHIMLCALAVTLTGCAMEAGPNGFRIAALQSKTRTEFIDADGSNFTSELDLAAFSKLEGDEAAMAYTWNQQGGEIGVGRSVRGLDQTPQGAVMAAITEAAVGAAVNALAPHLIARFLPKIPDEAEDVGGGDSGHESPRVPTIVLPDGSRVRRDMP